MRTVEIIISYEAPDKGAYEVNNCFTGEAWSADNDAILIHTMKRIEKSIIKEYEEKGTLSVLNAELMKLKK